MNIASIQFPCFTPYVKSTVEIYISGCNRLCEGCHNPELQDFNYGSKINIEELIKYLSKRSSLFEIISITGGDLLCQNEKEAINLVFNLKSYFGYKKFWLFTGEEIENCPKWVLDSFDVIKTGVYQEKLKQEGFPASTNQKLLRKGIDY
jgi:anaerobic ribonucleoside-triphosphate reductase activating protein